MSKVKKEVEEVKEVVLSVKEQIISDYERGIKNARVLGATYDKSIKEIFTILGKKVK